LKWFLFIISYFFYTGSHSFTYVLSLLNSGYSFCFIKFVGSMINVFHLGNIFENNWLRLSIYAISVTGTRVHWRNRFVLLVIFVINWINSTLFMATHFGNKNNFIVIFNVFSCQRKMLDSYWGTLHIRSSCTLHISHRCTLHIILEILLLPRL